MLKYLFNLRPTSLSKFQLGKTSVTRPCCLASWAVKVPHRASTSVPWQKKVHQVLRKNLGSFFEKCWVFSLKFQLYSLEDLNFDTFEVQMFKNAYYYFCPENWRCRDYIQTIRAEFATHPTCNFERIRCDVTFILPMSWGNMSDEHPSGVCESWVKGVLKRAESAAKTASQSAKEVHWKPWNSKPG